jgi:hypothetical protein
VTIFAVVILWVNYGAACLLDMRHHLNSYQSNCRNSLQWGRLYELQAGLVPRLPEKTGRIPSGYETVPEVCGHCQTGLRRRHCQCPPLVEILVIALFVTPMFYPLGESSLQQLHTMVGEYVALKFPALNAF